MVCWSVVRDLFARSMVLAMAIMAQGLGIEGLLLCRRQRRVESLGGFSAAVGLGVALGALLLHVVKALRRGQLGKAFAVQVLGRSHRLDGFAVALPVGLLGFGQLQCRLEFLCLLGHALFMGCAVA